MVNAFAEMLVDNIKSVYPDIPPNIRDYRYRLWWVITSCCLYIIMLVLFLVDFIYMMVIFGRFLTRDRVLRKSMGKTIAIYIIVIVFYIFRSIWAGLERYKYYDNTPINYSQQIINRLCCILLFLFLSLYLENWLTVVFCVVDRKVRVAILSVFIVIEVATTAICLGFTIERAFDKEENSIFYEISVQVCGYASLLTAVLFLCFGIACLVIVKNTVPDLKHVAVVFATVGTIVFALSLIRFIFMGYYNWTGKTINPNELFAFFNYTFVDIFEGLIVYIMLKKQIKTTKKSYSLTRTTERRYYPHIGTAEERVPI